MTPSADKVLRAFDTPPEAVRCVIFGQDPYPGQSHASGLAFSVEPSVMFKEITTDNWLLYAQHNYDNPTLEREKEFYDDIKRFKYIKRLFRKYKITGEIKVRLIVNHIIVLQNVFGVEAACVLLLFKVDKQYWPILKTVLDALGYLYPHELNDVKIDENVKKLLEEL